MNNKYKLLIVEDDHCLALSLRSLIYTHVGSCDCWLAENLKSALSMVAESDFDLIILDRNLTDGDGLRVIDIVRKKSFQTKFLILSNMGGVKERELGLITGAHDYLPKPFSKIELTQKVKILLNMTIRVNKKTFCYDKNFVFSTKNMTVEVDGHANSLTATDCKLLAFFIENNNLLISRDRLIDLIWHERGRWTANAINAKIYRLRKKMGRFGELLRATYNYGYQLKMTNKLMTITNIN